MNYIVFDLEWNQSPGGKKYSNSRLPFEIIEIGAVKMNEQREVVDVFQRLVKPQVYNWIHDSIHEVIHVDYKDLADGVPFPQAVEEFLDWCGEERVFCTWGNQDVMELQRNMKYYGLLKKIKVRSRIMMHRKYMVSVIRKIHAGGVWNMRSTKCGFRKHRSFIVH